MAVELWDPTGDGTHTGWEDEAAGTSNIWDSIDDYVEEGIKDDDTSYVRSPNNSDSNSFWEVNSFSLPPESWSPTLITSVSCKVAYRKESSGVSGAADTISLSAGMVRSDESTILTDLVVVDSNVSASYVEQTIELTNPDTSASAIAWAAGRLRFFVDYTQNDGADTTTRIRITSAQIIINWDTSGQSQAPRSMHQFRLRRT